MVRKEQIKQYVSRMVYRVRQKGSKDLFGQTYARPG